MAEILYTGLHASTLDLLKENLQGQEAAFEEVDESEVRRMDGNLKKYGVLLVGEEVNNPVRVAQEAYARDKTLSVLLINDERNYTRVKQSLQFSPFVGPTVVCVSNQVQVRLADMVQDAMDRTIQRRSFQNIRRSVATDLDFSVSALEKVRGDYTARVLEEAPIGAALISKYGKVLTINAYAANLFGKSEREILAGPLLPLFPDEVQAEVRQFVNQEPVSEPKRVFELPLETGKKYLEISLAEVDDRNRENFRILIINDITETTLSQQRTQAHLQELEQMNANLKRLNTDLDTFVYTASHDLKSPILNIEGLVELLEESLGDKKQDVEEELEHIKTSVQRFKSTVEDLTEVARIQKSFEQEETLLQVEEMVGEVKDLISFEINAASAVVKHDSSAAPQLYFSKRNFKSILYNLISNAIKYKSPDRTPHIYIRTWQEGNDFYLQVHDNGLGIPESKKYKVFELFKRLHAHVKGTGIGLYIVKRIVQNNGGDIELQSTENMGSTFTVKLKV
ncbi:sensor histidine kinase [Pontibacter anaerobius]|uniref:histidine kinase n=1 Tax=Pontibacter anaerobius TaxID=2993940 RepID=A0ABT3RFA5_9BACT|nr:PAS domain-containing sensor histidine kinase [Pontibacter anaerobius]MCX2740314.1 ATP-binding protein [Pontibacter anaerobius]